MISPGLRRQRAQLARWLREWKIDGILRAEADWREDAPGPAQRRRGVAERVRGRAARPAVGQIRLLPPAAGGGATERPVYIAVLERVDGGFLVAPFGRFSTPALPGEWLTGLKALPLRVLCLWNAFIVSGDRLAAGWRAGEFSADRISRALAVRRCALVGKPLCGPEAARVGPPLRHPSDPRFEYMAMEAGVFHEALSALGEAAGAKSRSGGLVYELPRDSGLLAAEGRGRYKPARRGGKSNDSPCR